MTSRTLLPSVLWLSMACACAAEVSADVAPCADDAECPEGYQCNSGGTCSPADDGCESDLECAQGESCVSGACVIPNEGPTLCNSTGECPVTHACVQGVCTELGPDDCRVDAQCPDEAPDCDAASANDVGSCVAAPEEPACAEHASLVPGTDDCRCDDGYVADGDVCVPVRGADPPPTEEPPQEEPPVSQPPPQEPPPQQPPPEEPPPEEPVDCGPNATPDPYDPGSCMCDYLYVPNEQGTACVDECEELGWYGDGFYCDECAWPDPDCF